MNNDSVLTEGNVIQPEVLEAEPKAPENMITLMVLSLSLAHSVLGKKTPKGGKLEATQGTAVIEAIETAIKFHFPDIAPMILSLFGMEMMKLMPILQSPEKLVKGIVADFIAKTANACPSTQPNMG